MNCLVSPVLCCSSLHTLPRETKPANVRTSTASSAFHSIPRRINVSHRGFQAWTMAVTDISVVPPSQICVQSHRRQQKRKQSAKESRCQALPAFEGGDAQAAELTIAVLEERGVKEMLRKLQVAEIPEYYVKPESMRIQLETIVEADEAQNYLPIIDLASSRVDLVRSIGKALQGGFFQIINHGISPDLLKKIAAESNEFFALPVEEKLRCSTSKKVAGPIHFGGGSKGDWRDVLKIHCAPASEIAVEHWPVHPVGFRDTIEQYVGQNRALARRLLGIISESLGLDIDYIENESGDDARVLMAINHYPPCPDPSLTMGIREHSDPNTLTILRQDQVAGLQVHKDGLWIDVKPLDKALVVNAGDHLQILSNGRYPSCLHRVVTNRTHPRTSIALFFSPAMGAHIRPAPALVDEEHPPQYLEFTYVEYLKNFYQSGGPNKKVVLQQFQSDHDKPNVGLKCN